MKHFMPDDVRYTVSRDMIGRTERLLAEPASHGFEGSVLWIGEQHDTVTATVTRVHRPEQIATASEAGLSVEVTEAGLSALISSLGPHEAVLGRVHTHGNHDVAHSALDDANLIVAHPGAFSIVVPHFARHGIDLRTCGVHVLAADHRWLRLTRVAVPTRFTVA